MPSIAMKKTFASQVVLRWPNATLGKSETSSVRGLRIGSFSAPMIHRLVEEWEILRAARAILLGWL